MLDRPMDYPLSVLRFLALILLPARQFLSYGGRLYGLLGVMFHSSIIPLSPLFPNLLHGP